jgi:hypothetical protein
MPPFFSFSGVLMCVECRFYGGCLRLAEMQMQMFFRGEFDLNKALEMMKDCEYHLPKDKPHWAD